MAASKPSISTITQPCLKLSDSRHVGTAIGRYDRGMNRRHFLGRTAALAGTFTGLAATAKLFAAETNSKENSAPQSKSLNKLIPPNNKIPVAVCVSQNVTLIDFAGPWEVFNNVMLPERGGDMDSQMP